jgi:imidazole glycerol-phosphate synthase subunit HisH
MSIGIIDVGFGNLGSLKNALYCQGWNSRLISSPDDFDELTHLILPGVGAFSAAAKRLQDTHLFNRIRAFAHAGHPVMGICLGMQLLADRGSEGGDELGLGLISGRIIPVAAKGLRLPHVGWNSAEYVSKHPLFQGIRNDVDFYFVHSYRFVTDRDENILSTTEYGEAFPSIVGQGNVIGVQFHPEKSQTNGLRLLDNFCLWDGKC